MIDTTKQNSESRPPPLGGGPLGLGDPDDKRLRKTEKDIIIPKMLREEAAKKCENELKIFHECAKQSGLMVIFKCKEENAANQRCVKTWAENPEFVQQVTEKYLNARSHYRRTGEPLEKYVRKRGGAGIC